MPDYIFVYHGGKMPANPEEAKKSMAAWMAWFGGMAAAVVDGGNPVGMSSTVSKAGVADNGGANPVSGYSIIRADDIAGAIAHAKGCPICAEGGSVEVAEIIPM
tara:strand:+ start:1593 stop:1904 length:312 start_codon:yes stop_codon:yes gene_type:complete